MEPRYLIMSIIFPDTQQKSLLEFEKTTKKISLNYHKNLEQDQTENIDQGARDFVYDACRKEYWNPKEFSFLYGTDVWRQATDDQKLVLNHIYWVAYYAQIISAEIATILFNQTSAAGLYGLEDFRVVCDMLDLESAQERAHINAFKTIGEGVEKELFGSRLFSFPMRTPFTETMIYPDSNRLKHFWKKLQLYAFTMLSSGNAFIACQYFAVRGVRTLNGKLVQHRLSQYYFDHPDQEHAPIPSKISYHHFMDESYHFNSSRILSHDILKVLKPPTTFERWVINHGLRGCQRDHYNFSSAINGIFWFDPALYPNVYALFLSPVFGMDAKEAKKFMGACFAEECDGVHESFKTHQTALESYKAYVADLDHLDGVNKEMRIMAQNSIQRHLATNRKALDAFFQTQPVQ